MTWTLILTIVVYGSLGTANTHISKIGSFKSREACMSAGRAFVNENTSHSVRASYVCVNEYKGAE